MTKRLELLIGQYMVANPNADSPLNYSLVYSDAEIQQMLIEANNELIEFAILTDKDTGDLIPDLIVPLVDGRPLPSFDIDLKKYSLEI